MDMLHIDALQMAALQKKMKSIGAFSIDGLIGYVPPPIRPSGAAPHCR
jgi:hypothetical protein